MADKDEALVDALRRTLASRSHVPDRVRAHEFRPDTWRRWIGDVPPASAVINEHSAEAAPTGRVSRTDLVSLASVVDESEPDSARRLFVATMIWGSGTSNGRGPRYTAAALDDDRLVPSLLGTRRMVLDGDLARAYPLFRSRGIGPAFFTKWFWAVGLGKALNPTPLILDARVWASLGALGWDSRTAAGSNLRCKRYVAYLETMEQWAAAGLPNIETAEHLEEALFSWAGGR